MRRQTLDAATEGRLLSSGPAYRDIVLRQRIRTFASLAEASGHRLTVYPKFHIMRYYYPPLHATTSSPNSRCLYTRPEISYEVASLFLPYYKRGSVALNSNVDGVAHLVQITEGTETCSPFIFASSQSTVKW